MHAQDCTECCDAAVGKHLPRVAGPLLADIAQRALAGLSDFGEQRCWQKKSEQDCRRRPSARGAAQRRMRCVTAAPARNFSGCQLAGVETFSCAMSIVAVGSRRTVPGVRFDVEPPTKP